MSARTATPPTAPPAIAPMGVLCEVTWEFGSADEDEDDAALDGKNAAASFGFEERNPAVTSPTGHPDVHAGDLQQPINGGDVAAHVYHLLLVEHC